MHDRDCKFECVMSLCTAVKNRSNDHIESPEHIEVCKSVANLFQTPRSLLL